MNPFWPGILTNTSIFRVLFFSCLILANNSLFSQTDSLELLLKKTTNDSVKMKLRFEIAEANSVFRITFWDSAQVECGNLAVRYKHKKSLYNYFLTLKSDAINNIGYILKTNGNDWEALKQYEKSLGILRETGDVSAISNSLNNIGVVYKHIGDIKKALTYLQQSIVLLEKKGDQQEIIQPLNNIAGLYVDQGDTLKALEYYTKCLEMAEKAGNKKYQAGLLNNMGLLHFSRENYAKALEFYTRSLAIFQEIGAGKKAGTQVNNIGLVYDKQGNLEKALEFYDQAEKMHSETGNKEGLTTVYANKAGLFVQKHELQKALNYSKKSLTLCKELGYPRSISLSAQLQSKIYKALGDYKNAVVAYDLYVVMRDSVKNENTRKASIKNQLKYEYEKNAAQDSVKHAEAQKIKDAELKVQQAQIKQSEMQSYALGGGLLLLAVGLGFSINRYRTASKQKKIIQQQKIQVDEAFAQLHQKNKEVMDSIYYARRIQRALITNEAYIKKNLSRLSGKKA